MPHSRRFNGERREQIHNNWQLITYPIQSKQTTFCPWIFEAIFLYALHQKYIHEITTNMTDYSQSIKLLLWKSTWTEVAPTQKWFGLCNNHAVDVMLTIWTKPSITKSSYRVRDRNRCLKIRKTIRKQSHLAKMSSEKLHNQRTSANK